MTPDRLRDLLYYSVVSGRFYWISDRVCGKGRIFAKAGSSAGCTDKLARYVRIRLDGKLYHAHRLAWLYVTGKFPASLVDHVDLIRANNAWINLRAATKSENSCNSKTAISNTSGYKGVTWFARDAKWCAAVQRDGKRIFLGYFKDKEQARLAVEAGRNEHHGDFANHG